MELVLSDTIVALASPPGNSVRGIVRVSGPDAASVPHLLKADSVEIESREMLASRQSVPIKIGDAKRAIHCHFYTWPTNRSFTGQPMCEIHCIGSGPLLDALIEETCKHGIRPARRGEFTLRAFIAGKLDLVQAEAVLGVIDSTDDEELLNAVKQLGGNLSSPLKELRTQLLNDLADLEAGLDFVEEDIDFVNREFFVQRLKSGIDLVSRLTSQAHHRSTMNHTKKVVLAGLPNAGKSTLFNRLIGSNHAIVSQQAGTTRDVLSSELNWNGHAIELVDTAGWESTSEDIMEAAQKLRQEQLENADLVCWCSAMNMEPDQQKLDDSLCSESQHANVPVFRVLTKSDLATNTGQSSTAFDSRISASKGQGINEFQTKVIENLERQVGERSGLLATTFARCRVSLEQTATALTSALHLAEKGEGDELISLEIRLALQHLGEVTGEVYTDEILDRIFSKFCIGK